MKGYLSLIFIFALIVSPATNLNANEIIVDPNIETISSGPIKEVSPELSYRYRIVTVLSEVYIQLYLQKIQFGEENCCAKVTKSRHIDKNTYGAIDNIYDISSISWISYDSLEMKINSNKYIISNLDNHFTIKPK